MQFAVNVHLNLSTDDVSKKTSTASDWSYQEKNFTFVSNQKHFPDLQSSTKMLRKTDVTMSNFKIKLVKALKTTTTPPPPPKKKNVEVHLVLCTFNMFKLFRESKLGNRGTGNYPS